MENNPTISEMNEVIARFMELDPIPAGTLPLGKINWPKVSVPLLRYDRDWNELMLVWKRFIDLCFDDDKLQLKHSELKEKIGYAMLYGTVAVAHSDLYQGIQCLINIQTMANKKTGNDLTPRQFVESILPKHYTVSASGDYGIYCTSQDGICDADEWDTFIAAVNQYFVDSLTEVCNHHGVCHVCFSVYYDYMKLYNLKIGDDFNYKLDKKQQDGE